MFRETSAAAVEQALRGVGRRLEAIADNLANAETPGYRARRVSFEEALRAAIHREQAAEPGDSARHAVDEVAARMWQVPVPPGSQGGIDPEAELTSLAANSLQYDALTRVAAKRLRMLRTAITGTSG
jgi:flagellar basal-body rod protein FlgB